MARPYDMSVPLASYKQRSEYKPQVGDFIIWTGWFKTWYGVVATVDGDKLSVIFETLPCILFTLNQGEQTRNTHSIDVNKITSASPGEWAVMGNDQKHNTPVWFI